MADKSLAKALKRKMGLDEDILAKTRVIKAEVSLLMNDTRRRVFEYVCNFPCSHLRAISRGLDLSPQTVRWHLLKLMGGELITQVQRGGKKLHYPFKNIFGNAECSVLHLLARRDTLVVYRSIVQQPERTQKEIGKALGIYQQKLSTALLHLERAGLITHVKKGRENVYSATEKAEEVASGLESKAPLYERTLMTALVEDGLTPTLTETEKSVMIFQLDIGAKEHPVLKVSKNPLAALLESETP